MIEIYKSLPGNNCGECGLPTCMAFALKVQSSQLDIGKCPYISDESLKLTPHEAEPSADGNYERVSDKLEREAVEADFKAVAEATGGEYSYSSEREAVKIRMINRLYEMQRGGLFEDGIYSQDSWAKIIIYDYILRKGTQSLIGDRVALGYFPSTASLVNAFQSNAEEKIAARFNMGIDALKERCREFRGIEISDKVRADYICRFNLLPRIPVYLSFWAADDEFDASCRLFFDSSSEDYIDIEYLAHLLERFAGEFTE